MPVDEKITFRQFLAGLFAVASVSGFIAAVVYIGLALFDKSINDGQFAYVLLLSAFMCTWLVSVTKQK